MKKTDDKELDRKITLQLLEKLQSVLNDDAVGKIFPKSDEKKAIVITGSLDPMDDETDDEDEEDEDDEVSRLKKLLERC